jgi:hypothetical protein
MGNGTEVAEMMVVEEGHAFAFSKSDGPWHALNHPLSA